ncbi:hypothetical protein Tco_0134429 [Tanacetum coccineum]
MVRQKAILDLVLQFDNACTTKYDLRKAYEKFGDASVVVKFGFSFEFVMFAVSMLRLWIQSWGNPVTTFVVSILLLEVMEYGLT